MATATLTKTADMSVPLRPPAGSASPQGVRSARMTTFHLKTTTDGDSFCSHAERADSIFTQSILPMAPSNQGFIDCQRLVNTDTGEFKILSLWENPDDRETSGNNNEYYAGGLVKLRNCAMHGMFKTELFEALTIWPLTEDGLHTTPFVRTSTMQLDAEMGDLEQVDMHFKQVIEVAKRKPGFVGAQRLLGTGDAKGTYMCISYWDSYAALQASSRGTDYYDQFLGSFGAESGSPSGFRQYLRPSTDVTTFQYNHLHYERPQALLPGVKRDSMLATTFQLSAISFGVGVFAMPSVFAAVGWLPGALLLVIFGLFSDFAMQLILKVAAATNACTYEEVLLHAFGPVGRVVTLVSLALSTFTANCAHMQFVSTMFVEMNGPDGGIMHTLVGPENGTQRFATLLLFGTLALPLCFKRRLSDLRYVSLGVVIFCLCASAVVVVKSLVLISDGGAKNTDKVATITGFGQMLNNAPVVAFGFSSIVELFHVRAEMHKPELLGRCVHYASAIVAGLYMTIGLVGTFAFSTPGSNVLQNFPDSHLVSIIRLGIIVMITLLYPIINFPCCQAIDALVAGRYGTPSRRRWNTYSILGLLAVLLIDSLVKALDAVFGLSGSLGLGLVAYTLPCAAGCAVAFGRSTPHANAAEVRKLRAVSNAVPMVFILLIGLVMTFGATAWILYGVVKGS